MGQQAGLADRVIKLQSAPQKAETSAQYKANVDLVNKAQGLLLKGVT